MGEGAGRGIVGVGTGREATDEMYVNKIYMYAPKTKSLKGQAETTVAPKGG